MDNDTETLVKAYAFGLVLLTVAILFEIAAMLALAFVLWIVAGAWYGRKKGIEAGQNQSA